MTTMIADQTIRRNASKKIKGFLSQAVGFILFDAHSNVDDSWSHIPSIVNSAEEAYAWFVDPYNYEDAKVVIDNNIMRLRGKYYWQSYIAAYFDEAAYKKAVDRLNLADADVVLDNETIESESVTVKAQTEVEFDRAAYSMPSSNVVYVDFSRKVLH